MERSVAGTLQKNNPVNRVGTTKLVVISQRWKRYMKDVGQPLLCLWWDVRHRSGDTVLGKGSICTITHDIFVSGRGIFNGGERVVIDKVSPNRKRPENKYVVRSVVAKKRYQLAAQDLQELESEPPVYDAVNADSSSVGVTASEDATELASAEEPPSASMGIGGCILTVLAVVSLGVLIYFGIRIGGWFGALIAFIFWVVAVGSLAQGFNIASAGEASRKYLRRTKGK